MTLVKLNEAELTKIVGGTVELGQFKNGFKEEVVTPARDVKNLVTGRTLGDGSELGRITGAAAIFVVGALAPWACKKMVQIKNVVFG